MTARVLVVDDVAANVKLLQARLMAEYFEVLTATNGPDALEICRAGRCDMVLLDVMMPGMDGFTVCRELKADPLTAHLPVILVSALDKPSDKLEGLNAGADDFLTKPVSDLPLLTRVKSLARLKMMTDELHLRLTSASADGSSGPKLDRDYDPQHGRGANVLIVDDIVESSRNLERTLSAEHNVVVENDPNEALYRAANGAFDLVVLSLSVNDFDALRLCSQLRSLDSTRTVPILVLADEGDDARLIRAIDLGVNDYVTRPCEPNELLARTRTLVRRKRLTDTLRENVQNTMEMAVRDSLTGMNNRRYFDKQLASAFNRATVSAKPLSVIMIDIDHFKAVNDTHGHDAGDQVLRLFSERVMKSVRGNDIACRFGGEEFVIALPGTDRELAMVVAERMRREIENCPIAVRDGAATISVTLSAGVAALGPGDASVDDLMKRADRALYEAKHNGRNQVTSFAA